MISAGDENEGHNSNKDEMSSSADGNVEGDDKVNERGDRPKKPPPIENFVQLFSEIYGGTFKRQKVSSGEATNLQKQPALSADVQQSLLLTAGSDQTLKYTRQLLLLAVRNDSPVIASRCCEFAREVLRRHPVFLLPGLADVLNNLADSSADSRAVKLLASKNYLDLEWPPGVQPLDRKQSEECSVNAVHCLLLLYWSDRQISLQAALRYLHAALLDGLEQRIRSDSERLSVLLGARDPAVAAVTFRLMERQAEEQSRRAQAANAAEARANAKADELEKMLEDASLELAQVRAQIAELRRQLEEALKAGSTKESHLKDDYERLRGNIVRRLKEEVSLLDDGLHALRREPPKVHVMIDHAERAIDGLKQELERLRGDH